MSKGKVAVFGCGGAGVNIVNRFEGHPPLESQATITPYYFDTSAANMRNNIDPNRYYILKDKDGSGGVRAENYDPISKVIRNVLQEHEPVDFNIVVFSASGGSGSVAGPLIVKEMLERDLPVVAIVVGASESNLATENTMKTLKSLDNIASNVIHKPVVIHYVQNSADVKRSETDHMIMRVIVALSIMASGDNHALDRQDILHFLQYHRATKVKPGLALLEVYEENAAVSRHKTPIGIISLLKNPDEPTHSVIPEYTKVGYPRTEPGSFNLLHFVIDHGEISDIAKNMTDMITEQDKLRQSRVNPGSLISGKDISTEDGMVL
jgi:hypothetical protein